MNVIQFLAPARSLTRDAGPLTRKLYFHVGRVVEFTGSLYHRDGYNVVAKLRLTKD